jgi:hypothetical protein
MPFYPKTTCSTRQEEGRPFRHFHKVKASVLSTVALGYHQIEVNQVSKPFSLPPLHFTSPSDKNLKSESSHLFLHFILHHGITDSESPHHVVQLQSRSPLLADCSPTDSTGNVEISSSLIFRHSQTLIDWIDVDIYSGKH